MLEEHELHKHILHKNETNDFIILIFYVNIGANFGIALSLSGSSSIYNYGKKNLQ